VEEAMCISIEEWRERLSKYFELYGLRAFLCYSKDDIVKSDILRAPLLKRYEKSYGSTEAVMAACNFYFKSAFILSPISFTSNYGSSRLFSTMEIIRLIGFASSVCVRVAAQNSSKEFSYGYDAPNVQMKEDLGIVSCNDETKNFLNNYEHVDGDARCYERKDHIGSLQSHGEKKGKRAAVFRRARMKNSWLIWVWIYAHNRWRTRVQVELFFDRMLSLCRAMVKKILHERQICLTQRSSMLWLNRSKRRMWMFLCLQRRVVMEERRLSRLTKAVGVISRLL